jgi:hypothetical protein
MMLMLGMSSVEWWEKKKSILLSDGDFRCAFPEVD